MADPFETITRLAAGALADGEAVRTAALVSYGGKVNVNQPPPGLSALGMQDAQVAAGEALVDRYGDRPGVAFPTARQMAIVLTDRRLLVWSRGLGGKVKAFIGEVPVDGIASVERGEGRTGTLTIHMHSGWEVHLEVTRDDGRRFVDVLHHAVAATGGA